MFDTVWKKWTIYETNAWDDSVLVHTVEARSFKLAAEAVARRRWNIGRNKLVYSRKDHTYSIDRTTYSLRPIFNLIIKAGVYDGVCPFTNRPSLWTVKHDIYAWRGFAKSLKDAIRKAGIPDEKGIRNRRLKYIRDGLVSADSETFRKLYFGNAYYERETTWAVIKN